MAPIPKPPNIKNMTTGKLAQLILANIFGLPGLGQFSMGRKERGLIWMLVVLGLLISFLVQFQQAMSEQAALLNPKSNDLNVLFNYAKHLLAGSAKAYAGLIKGYGIALISVYFLSLLDLIYLFVTIRKEETRIKPNYDVRNKT